MVCYINATFRQYSHFVTLEIVITANMQYIYDSRGETFVRVSQDSRETFLRVSHDVCANVAQYYFLRLSSKTSFSSRNLFVFVSHIHRIVQLAETKLQ